jgi:cyclase
LRDRTIASSLRTRSSEISGSAVKNPRRCTTCCRRGDASSWAREAADRGAGEILLTSIDRDGTRQGFDCELTSAIASAVPIPVIASGGAGSIQHFVEVFQQGAADAALAASIFHYAESNVRRLKEELCAHNIPVRL